MYILSKSFILDPKTRDVTIIEILMDYKGKQEGMKRRIRKLDTLPKKLKNRIQLPINISHYETYEIHDSNVKAFFNTEHNYELYLDIQELGKPFLYVI